MIFKYQSREEIKKGDRILFHGEPGEIELVASELGSSETDWWRWSDGSRAEGFWSCIYSCGSDSRN
jgi:hypothetical protein